MMCRKFILQCCRRSKINLRQAAFNLTHNVVLLWTTQFVRRWMTKETTTSSAASEKPGVLDGPRQKDLSVVGHTCNDWDFVAVDDLDLLVWVLMIISLVISAELLLSRMLHYSMRGGDDSAENYVPTMTTENDLIESTSFAKTTISGPKHVRFIDVENMADRIKTGRRKVKRRLSPNLAKIKVAHTSKRPKRKAAAISLGRVREIMADEVIIVSP